MLIRNQQYTDGIIIGLWRIEESAEELLRLLDDQTFETAIAKISSEKRKREKLAVQLLLKTIVGNPVSIIYNEYGAPALADGSHHISISHCKDFAAVILHPTKRTGIDIEQISPRIEKLKHKFLSENEWQNIDENKRIEQLFVYWCAKETLFKMMSENEIHFAGQLHIAPFLLQEKGTLNAHETRTQRQEQFVLHYEIGKDFVMVFATGN